MASPKRTGCADVRARQAGDRTATAMERKSRAGPDSYIRSSVAGTALNLRGTVGAVARFGVSRGVMAALR